jgi:hypothetical protein
MRHQTKGSARTRQLAKYRALANSHANRVKRAKAATARRKARDTKARGCDQ